MIIIIILAGFRGKKDRTRARRHFCRFSRLVEDLDFLDVVHFVSDPHGPLLRSRCNISYVHTYIYMYKGTKGVRESLPSNRNVSKKCIFPLCYLSYSRLFWIWIVSEEFFFDWKNRWISYITSWWKWNWISKGIS